MVFYRKYRPQSLTQLIGQEQVRKTLENAFSNNRLAHAYLFYGTRGTGKTSTARILAKMVNCDLSRKELKDLSLIPCNNCSSCSSISDGSNLDLIEIDAASNRGIDDIRDLRDKVKLSPTQSVKKVYIIDEVHMLTTEAFNALLKTLEEPPEHVLFILATTEVNKIPQTILSRVQKINFSTASNDSLVENLRKIIEVEKIEIEEDALKLISKRSEGSFRDSLKVLDQLSSAGEKITVKMVEDSFKAGSFENTLIFAKEMLSRNSNGALDILNSQALLGVSFKDFMQEIQLLLRQMVFIKNSLDKLSLDDLGDEKFAQVKDLALNFSQNDLIHALELLQEAYEKMRFTSIASLPLEIAVLEYSQNKEKNTVVITSEVSKLQQIQVEEPRSEIKNIEDTVKEVVAKTEMLKDDTSLNEVALIHDKWNYILETIKPYNYSLEALLRQSKVLTSSEGLVTIEVPYSFHQRILEAPKSRTLLESVLSDILGKSVRTSCVLGKRPMRVEELANIELAGEDEVVKLAAEIFNS